tara:strand:- start:181 stop:342 length:162 start_codon:yes stop_codon:yes gene_type:complete
MKEKLKKYKLIGLKLSEHSRLVSVGKLKQKGLATDSHFSMGKNYYWVLRGHKV